jgi:tight adherence protein B
MTLLVITIMVFLVTLGLTVSALYFFVESPAAKKRMRARLAGIEEASARPAISDEMQMMREEVVGQLPSFNRLLMQIPIMGKVHLFIEQSAVNITGATLLLISLAIGIVVFIAGLLTFLPSYIMLGVAAFAAAIPFFVVQFQRHRRFLKFSEQFPDAIDMLGRAVRAGHAFTTGLELIAKEMPDPLAREFRITYEQQNFGLPLKEALQNLSVRMPLADVSFFTSALQIQRESGGNLGEILDNLALVIRERFKIQRQVRVVTAQGRMTLYLLMALTPGFALLMYLRNPKYIGRLVTDPLGQKALGFTLALQVIGFLIIRKIIRIKV